MNTIKKILSVGLTLSVLSSPCFADTVRIPLGQQGKAWNVQTPGIGKTKDQVETSFGAPINKSGPVGEPAIYTWEYENFNVYFEGEHVIHSVVKQMKK